MNSEVLQGSALPIALMRLDDLLTQTLSLWRPPEFTSSGIETAYQHISQCSALALIVNQLSLEQLDAIDAEPEQLCAYFGRALGTLVPDYVAILNDLAALLVPSTEPIETASIRFPFWLETGIGGRKLAQIKHFIQATAAHQGDVLEWCAGKGHLGRLWLYHAHQQGNDQTHMHSLEWQAQLCQQGAKLAEQLQLAQTFYPQDALQPIPWTTMHTPDHALALHACGDLHRSLLRQGVAQGLTSFALAPCCYHLTADNIYQPFSQQLRATSTLRLSKAELKLAVQGQVTGGRRIGILRQQEVLWRLAYQCLREESLGAECDSKASYRPLPALPKVLLSEGFEKFLDWAFTQHNWRPERAVNSQQWLTRARELQLKLRRVDVVRHNFRRLLELWLVLDRAVYLQEHQYQVEVLSFCPYRVSPRNLLIRAHKLNISNQQA